MQQVFGGDAYGLEVLGIVLAVLSFTGASSKLESALDAMRQWIRAYTPVLRNGLTGFLPTPRNFIDHGASYVWSISVMLVVFAVGMTLAPETHDMMMGMWQIFGPVTYWKVGLALGSGPINLVA